MAHKAVNEYIACLRIPGTSSCLLLSHYGNQLYSVDFSHLANVPAESGVLTSNTPLLSVAKLHLVEADQHRGLEDPLSFSSVHVPGSVLTPTTTALSPCSFVWPCDLKTRRV